MDDDTLDESIILDIVDDKPKPIPVHIVGSDINQEEGTEYASGQTYRLVGTEAMPVRILAQDLRRKRAVVIVNAGFFTGNTAGYIVLGFGTPEQVQNGQGFLMTAGNQLTMEHGRAVYLMPDGVAGHDLTVSVEDERYSS